MQKYRDQLDELRREFSVRDLPDIRFFQFGMGNRKKLIYKNGTLYDPFTGEMYRVWPMQSEKIIPNEYRVIISTESGRDVVIFENESGMFIREGSKTLQVEQTDALVKLPEFERYRYSEVLKVLHHEILINIVDSKPLPNFLVYSNPWRRDGAMMAMCLDSTGNLSLIRDWVMSIRDPYDRNNAGETEADNLGQTLFLVSLFSDMTHPVVPAILKEILHYEVRSGQEVYICGRSDFHEVPAYQTKWLKYGLLSLGLPDHYTIPKVQDDYASLFWWHYRESYLTGTTDAYEEWGMDKDPYPKYPYIGWAADHFHGKRRNAISNRDYPLSWEQDASQADYSGMKPIDEIFVKERISIPHTWHASEMFLYLLEFK